MTVFSFGRGRARRVYTSSFARSWGLIAGSRQMTCKQNCFEWGCSHGSARLSLLLKEGRQDEARRLSFGRQSGKAITPAAAAEPIIYLPKHAGAVAHCDVLSLVTSCTLTLPTLLHFATTQLSRPL